MEAHGIEPEKLIITGHGQLTEESAAELRAWVDQAHAETLARIRAHSRFSGMEVVYDASLLDIAWDPVFWHESDEPIAWIHRVTGERREGAALPD